MTAVDPDVSFLVDALEPRGPSTQEVLAAEMPDDPVPRVSGRRWVAMIESARAYPGTASGRATIMSISKA